MIILIFHCIAVKQFQIALIVAHCKAKYIYTFTLGGGGLRKCVHSTNALCSKQCTYCVQLGRSGGQKCPKTCFPLYYQISKGYKLNLIISKQVMFYKLPCSREELARKENFKLKKISKNFLKISLELKNIQKSLNRLWLPCL